MQPLVPARSRLTRLPAALITIVASATLSAFPLPSLAHSPAQHGARSGPVVNEQKDWGIAGEARRVSRTVEVRMGDDMRFTPSQMRFKRGETVRFVVHNDGKQMHEFVIGTQAENAVHADLMLKHPNMEHDEPWMAHVEPGSKGEMIWTFNRAGSFEFACLIAGHFQAGMVGRIEVQPEAQP